MIHIYFVGVTAVLQTTSTVFRSPFGAAAAFNRNPLKSVPVWWLVDY